MAEQEQNRSEPATPFKLREARKRGQVPKSIEVNSFAALCGFLAILYFVGESLIGQQLAISSALLGNAHNLVMEGQAPIALFEELTNSLLGIYWPILLVAVVVAICTNLAQTGPVFSFFALKPDIQRLNPVEGFKRVFSKRLLFEALKTSVKFVVLGITVYLAITSLLPSLMTLIDVAPDSYALVLLNSARRIVFQLLLVLLLIALFDLAYNRWDFAQRMRMSRRELKEEVKRREGDPLIRAKLRQLQREAVKRAGALKRVPEADVLITNPTHLAVALKYDNASMRAPVVIAKGAGELALRMREVAFRNRVPIVENKRLARTLFTKVDLEGAVTEDLYPVIARLMAWVWMLQRRTETTGLKGSLA